MRSGPRAVAVDDRRAVRVLREGRDRQRDDALRVAAERLLREPDAPPRRRAPAAGSLVGLRRRRSCRGRLGGRQGGRRIDRRGRSRSIPDPSAAARSGGGRDRRTSGPPRPPPARRRGPRSRGGRAAGAAADPPSSRSAAARASRRKRDENAEASHARPGHCSTLDSRLSTLGRPLVTGRTATGPRP